MCWIHFLLWIAYLVLFFYDVFIVLLHFHSRSAQTVTWSMSKAQMLTDVGEIPTKFGHLNLNLLSDPLCIYWSFSDASHLGSGTALKGFSLNLPGLLGHPALAPSSSRITEWCSLSKRALLQYSSLQVVSLYFLWSSCTVCKFTVPNHFQAFKLLVQSSQNSLMNFRQN